MSGHQRHLSVMLSAELREDGTELVHTVSTAWSSGPGHLSPGLNQIFSLSLSYPQTSQV